MWKDALNIFIKEYEKDANVEAILLVGSYAANNNDEYSDIDVYIILNNEAKYRKRGNKLVDDYMIEYFVNPVDKIKEYLKDDYEKHRISTANMLINGKVLFERNNIVRELKELANDYLNKENKNQDPFKYYACWCCYDEYLAQKDHNSLQYYLCLKNLIEAYFIKNGYNLLPELKLERFFRDEKYRNNYNVGRFPVGKFNELVIKCFDKEAKENLKNLYEFVMNDGQFDINNFEFKEEL